MAGNDVRADHPDMDYAEHERTYHAFLHLMQWSLIACIVIMIGLAVTTL